jgi:uncharacterized protein (TIGR02996 family)
LEPERPVTHDAFLKAIIENPDDDAIRLVYCDWLEEHGQPDRAAFIRVQCELARLPECDPRRPVLEARERALLARQGQWLGRLNSPLLHWRFRRGLVEGFAHAGLFKSTETVLEDEDDGGPDTFWGYLRFYADGRMLLAISDEPPAQVARWARWGAEPQGPPDADLLTGQYTLRQTSEAVELSVGILGLYPDYFRRKDFRGTLEVEPDLFGTSCLVRVVLEASHPNEQQRERQTYRLVEVPGYDSANAP